MKIFASLLILACGFFNSNHKVQAIYCDNDYCAAPNKYCCGNNECCNYVWTMWYLWLAFGSGLLLGVFVLWKYFCPTHRYLISNDSSKFWPNLSSPSSSASNKIDINNRKLPISNNFSYKPLNDIEFVEKHLDENTIQIIQQKMRSWNRL